MRRLTPPWHVLPITGYKNDNTPKVRTALMEGCGHPPLSNSTLCMTVWAAVLNRLKPKFSMFSRVVSVLTFQGQTGQQSFVPLGYLSKTTLHMPGRRHGNVEMDTHRELQKEALIKQMQLGQAKSVN